MLLDWETKLVWENGRCGLECVSCKVNGDVFDDVDSVGDFVAVMMQQMVAVTFACVIEVAVPFLINKTLDVAEEIISGVNNIFSVDNIKKALNNGYEGIKQAVDTTEEIGTKVFKGISEEAKKVADTAKNGVKFLCGMVKMFTGKIVEEITSLGVPKQACDNIGEITDKFSEAIIALGSKNKEQKKSTTPNNKGDKNSLESALLEIEDKAFSGPNQELGA